MKSIKELKNIKGKTVLVRVDFNVPMLGGKVGDDFRIRKALPTIEFLKKKGAKIILISHIGKGGETLEPVAKRLNKYLKAKFVPALSGEKVSEAVIAMKAGDVILLENLRNDPGEKSGSNIFAINIAKYADIYVNEAFSVSHREDASIVILPKILPSYAGFQLEAEIKNLSKAFKDFKKPFLFILGGAKFETKMPLIKKFIKNADAVFIGGALLNNFLEAQGFEIGNSLIDNGEYGIEKILKNKKLIIPQDVLIKTKEGKFENRNANQISKSDIIVDIGKDSVQMLETLIKKSKFILWNGPLGKYEVGGDGATKKILKAISISKAESLIGGGDTVDLISEMKMEEKFSFVSTGGGATLEFLSKGTLPGIKALG